MDLIRDELQRELGRQVSDSLWGYLKKRHVAEVADGFADIQYLVDVARDVLQIRSEPSAALTESVNKNSNSHIWARSMVVADIAREDPDVVAFRDGVLGGKLMSRKEVPGWIESRADEEPVVRWATVAVAAAPARSNSRVSGKPARWSTRLLKYAAPDEEWVRAIPTGSGILERLRRLSESLSNFYAWTEDQAVVFVLTDVLPLIAPVRARGPGMKIRHDMACTWAQRIELDIDPVMTPQEVAEAYRRIRNRNGRPRRISDKHAQLAIFKSDNSELRWADLLKQWNKKHAGWKYEHASNFRRDVLKAQARVLGVFDPVNEW